MEAIQLYAGEFLPGVYEDWCLAERERLAERYLGALRRLVGLLEREGEVRRALDYARRAATEARASETSAAIQALFQPLFRGHGGHPLPTDGEPDGEDSGRELQVSFGRASEALAAAVAARRFLLRLTAPHGDADEVRPALSQRAEEAATEIRMRAGTAVRIALHIGEVEPGNTPETCPALAVALRPLRSAHAGQIVVSSAVADLVSFDLEEPLSLVDLGLYRLRRGTIPYRLFQINDRAPGSAGSSVAPPVLLAPTATGAGPRGACPP